MNPLYEADTVIVAGVATTIATSLLKSKLIPVAFQNFPRLTAFVVSIIASVIAYSQKGIQISTFAVDPVQSVSYILAVFLMASITYNNIK